MSTQSISNLPKKKFAKPQLESAKMGTICLEYFFPESVTFDQLMVAIRSIREFKVDKNMTCKQLPCSTPDMLKFSVRHKMPNFVKVLLNFPEFKMLEHIDISKLKSDRPVISSTIKTIKAKMGIELKTETEYKTVEKGSKPKQIIALTKITLTAPFSIPDLMRPVIETWAKNKTNKIRELELYYAKESFL